MDIGMKLKIARGSSALSRSELLGRITAMNSKASVVQVFNSSRVINGLHLQAAYANATNAFSEGTNISNKPYLEFLLFAAMTRQIHKATSMFEVESSKDFIIASNVPEAIRAAKRFAKLSEFSVSREHELDAAKLFGIESDYAHLNRRILQKMAVSRLQD